jgi:hypothetical protein
MTVGIIMDINIKKIDIYVKDTAKNCYNMRFYFTKDYCGPR